MRDIVLGPTFEIELPGTADEAEGVLAAWVRSGACPYDAARAGSHFSFETGRATRRFWSPALTLEVVEANGRAVARGRFNPRPGIWTGYMMTYLALLTIVLGAAMWGLAELSLKQRPTALLFIPASVAVGAVMFAASAVGQRLAGPEMDAMRAAVEGVVLRPAASATALGADGCQLVAPASDGTRAT